MDCPVYGEEQTGKAKQEYADESIVDNSILAAEYALKERNGYLKTHPEAAK
jgi:hypothetical protein